MQEYKSYIPANLTCILFSGLNNWMYCLHFGAKSFTAHERKIVCWSWNMSITVHIKLQPYEKMLYIRGLSHNSETNFIDILFYMSVYYNSHILSINLLFDIRLSCLWNIHYNFCQILIIKDIGLNFLCTSNYLHIVIYTVEKITFISNIWCFVHHISNMMSS